MKAHRGDTTQPDFVNNIGCIYGATQRPDSAIYWFEMAHHLDSLDLTSVQFLDITYRAVGKTTEADYYKNLTTHIKTLRAERYK